MSDASSLRDEDFLPDSPGPRGQKSRRPKVTLLQVALFVLAGIGVCCGLVGWFFQPSETSQPEKVLAAFHAMVGGEPPADWQPERTLEWDIPFLYLRSVNFRHPEGRGRLLLTETKVRFGDPEEGAQALKSVLMREEAEFAVISAKSREELLVRIRGQDVTFSIEHGEDVGSNTRLLEARGEFSGTIGRVRLLLQCEESALENFAVQAWLKSLGGPGDSK